ncbi:hypothetical protein B0I10_1084 [Flavobacterium lacus]|uniref:Uncharacterized protein n=2 Tax=Flavobacterium lacus TaxID=1353778 RepID=A0A328WW36_9FLAO|nr:hypothetical protein B0I10_1084 [Flavobacterium lacus]
MKMINKFNSIQHCCVTLKAAVLICLIVLSIDKAIGQDGRFVLSNGLGGIPTSASNHIGSTSANWSPSPFISSKKDYRVQFLYEADELFLAEDAGYRKITSLAFNVVGFSSMFTLPNYEMQNITIKMGHTIATYDGYAGTNIWGIKMPPSGECTWDGSPTAEYLELVKSPFNLIISNTGWVEIDLEFPFIWDGVSSIVVEICKSDPRTNSPSTNFNAGRYLFEGIYHSNPPGSNALTLSRSLSSSINGGNNHTNGCAMQLTGSTPNTSGAISTTLRKYRPNIQFIFECAGAPKAGNAVISSENYCAGENVELHVVNDEQSTGLTYQWYYSYADDDNFLPLVGEINKTLSVERSEVDMWYVRHVGCSQATAEGTRISTAVKVKGINTWDGTFWSFGSEPATNEPVRINGDFNTDMHGTGLLEACTLYVESGIFTIKSGDVLSITDKLKVHESATLIFENNASLIQKNDSAINEGKIIYKRNSQPVRLLDYTYWSSPVSGMTPSQFSPSTPANRVYHWNHLTTGPSPQTWVGGVAGIPMTPGKGYIIRAPNGYPTSGAGTVFEGTFEGVPNNGIISVPAQGGLGNWNLIGNPYPAAIDIDEFLIANSAVLDGTIRLWTHNTLPSSIPEYPGFTQQALNYTSDDYATYNLTGPLGFPSESTGGNTSTPGRFVGAGQSFMVQGVAGGGAGVVQFTNEMRELKTGYSNTQFFRSSNGNQALSLAEKNRLWLEVIHQNGKFKQMMVGYVDGATDGLDWGYDSKLTLSGDVRFYSLLGEDSLLIQGKSTPFQQDDIIALGLTTVLSGEFIVNLYQFDGLFENQNVYLFDKYTTTFHNLKEGNYAFATEAGTFDDRFELRFTNEVLSLNPIVTTKKDIICFADDTVITVKSNGEQITDVKIVDSAGRVLFEQNKMNTTLIKISELAKANQLMIVQVISENGSKSMHKILF